MKTSTWILTCVLAVICVVCVLDRLCAEPLEPIEIKKWFIGWDRLAQQALLDGVFKNSAGNAVSSLLVTIEFFDEDGNVGKKSRPWSRTSVGPRSETNMKLTVPRCPAFGIYLVKVTGSVNGKAFEQLFEGKYWPEKPGQIPPPPQPTVFGTGSADVRVVGRKAELLRWKKREALKISGTVRNLGDRPAENIVVHVKLMDGKKEVMVKELKPEPSKIKPGGKAPFSLLLRRPPHHTLIAYKVDFDSIGGEEEVSEEMEPLAFEVGPVAVKDCKIDPRSGLLTGTLVNNGRKTLKNVVLKVAVEKDGKTTSYDINAGKEIPPGGQLSLIKATMPDFDGVSFDIRYKEK